MAHAFNRKKRNTSVAPTRGCAPVVRQVNQFHGLPVPSSGLPPPRPLAASVTTERLWSGPSRVQHVHARHAAHRRDNGVDLGSVASFGKIGHHSISRFIFFRFFSCLPTQLFAASACGPVMSAGSYTNASSPDYLAPPASLVLGQPGPEVRWLYRLPRWHRASAAAVSPPPSVFRGHWRPIIGFMLGGSAFFINCGAAGISCLDFSIVPVTACCFR